MTALTRTLDGVSPRRNKRLREGGAVDDEAARRGGEAVERSADGDWRVRGLIGGANQKTYRCPGCDQEIRPGVAHVVAWRDDGDAGDRRHWHTACWRARDRRAPNIQRSRSAPRYG